MSGRFKARILRRIPEGPRKLQEVPGGDSKVPVGPKSLDLLFFHPGALVPGCPWARFAKRSDIAGAMLSSTWPAVISAAARRCFALQDVMS